MHSRSNNDKNIFSTLPLNSDTPIWTHEMFQLLFQNSPDGMFITDIHGNIIDANDTVCSLSGYSREEILHKTILDFVSPRDFPKILKTLNRILVEKAVDLSDWIVTRKDGSKAILEVHAKFLVNGHVLGILREVTKQRELETRNKFFFDAKKILCEITDYKESLQKLVERLVPDFADACALFQKEKDKIVITNLAHTDPNLISTYKTLLERFPISTQQTPHGCSMSFEKTQIIERITPQFIDQVSINNEHRALLKKLNFQSCISIPLIARKNVIGVLVLSMCDSGRHYNYSNLELLKPMVDRFAYALDNSRLYEESKAALQLRGHMMSVVAHDLRSPLAVVKSTCNIIAESITRFPNSLEIANWIKMSDRNIDYALKLISDLLDISKLSSETFAIGPTTVFLPDLIDHVMTTYRILAGEKSIKIEINMDSQIKTIHCDSERLQQVLGNLFSNAIKFSRQGGNIKVNVRKNENNIEFSVQDNGPGIAAENLSCIFEKFWKLSQKSRSGVGLGLAIAKGIVDAHKGKIWAESSAGKGTTFFFTIPT